MTNDPAASISRERRLAISNLSDPDPSGWPTLVRHASAAVERIGYALTRAKKH